MKYDVKLAHKDVCTKLQSHSSSTHRQPQPLTTAQNHKKASSPFINYVKESFHFEKNEREGISRQQDDNGDDNLNFSRSLVPTWKSCLLIQNYVWDPTFKICWLMRLVQYKSSEPVTTYCTNDDWQSALSLHNLTQATMNTEAGGYFQTLAPTCHTTQHHHPEDQNWDRQCTELFHSKM